MRVGGVHGAREMQCQSAVSSSSFENLVWRAGGGIPVGGDMNVEQRHYQVRLAGVHLLVHNQHRGPGPMAGGELGEASHRRYEAWSQCHVFTQSRYVDPGVLSSAGRHHVARLFADDSIVREGATMGLGLFATLKRSREYGCRVRRVCSAEEGNITLFGRSVYVRRTALARKCHTPQNIWFAVTRDLENT